MYVQRKSLKLRLFTKFVVRVYINENLKGNQLHLSDQTKLTTMK